MAGAGDVAGEGASMGPLTSFLSVLNMSVTNCFFFCLEILYTLIPLLLNKAIVLLTLGPD